MSFGAAFDAFVGGFSKGINQGEGIAQRREQRRPAREAKELTEEASKAAFGTEPTILDRLKQKVSSLAIQPDKPVIPTEDGYYAEGGYVDPVEQDNGAYYRQEAARTVPDRAVSAPTNQPAPTPTPRPGGPTADLDSGGNIIQKTLAAVQEMQAPDQPAVPTGQPGPSGVHHPIQTMVDPTGRSYPDLTTTIGGIRSVTGAAPNRPLTTADHMNFLQTRFNLAIQKGYDPNEALKFNVQYLDNLRLQAGRSFALASAAWDAGDGDAVQKFVQNGYGLVPDGKSAKTSFANGKLTVTPIDEKTGKAAGDPVTVDKATFMQKAQSITGDPVSFGRALENEPLPAGYGGRSRRGSRGRRYSDAGTTTEAGGGGGETAMKPMSATEQGLFEKVFKGTPQLADAATRLRPLLPPDQRSPRAMKSIIDRAAGAPRDGEGGYGIYDKDGALVVKLTGKIGTPANKVTAEAPTGNPSISAVTASPGEPKMPNKPGAIATAPVERAPNPVGGVNNPPGAARAEGTSPTPQAVPTNAEPQRPGEPGLLERFKNSGKAYGQGIKDAVGLNGPREVVPTTPAASSRIPALEARLAEAEKNGAPATTLNIIRAQIERERAAAR